MRTFVIKLRIGREVVPARLIFLFNIFYDALNDRLINSSTVTASVSQHFTLPRNQQPKIRVLKITWNLYESCCSGFFGRTYRKIMGKSGFLSPFSKRFSVEIHKELRVRHFFADPSPQIPPPHNERCTV